MKKEAITKILPMLKTSKKPTPTKPITKVIVKPIIKAPTKPVVTKQQSIAKVIAKPVIKPKVPIPILNRSKTPIKSAIKKQDIAAKGIVKPISKPKTQLPLTTKLPNPLKSKITGKTQNSIKTKNTPIVKKPGVISKIISKPLIRKSSSVGKVNIALKGRNTPVLPIRVPLPTAKSQKALKKILPKKPITSDLDIKPKLIIKPAVTPSIAVPESEESTPAAEILRNYYHTLVEHNISPKAVELTNIQKVITFLINTKGPGIIDIYAAIREICPTYNDYLIKHNRTIKAQVDALHYVLTLNPMFIPLTAEEFTPDFLG